MIILNLVNCNCRNSSNFRADLKLNFFPILHTGIPWYVKACVEVKEGVDYVGVYLYHKSIIYWSVVATFEIRLLCSDPLGNSTFVVSRDLEFKNPDKFKAWGYSKFISVDKLRSGSFIQNDTVKIQVQISTKSFKIAN